MTGLPHRHSEKATVPSRDVFISYAQADRNIARQLAERLQERGLSIWLGISDIEAGINWSTALREAVENCRLCVVLVSNKATPSTRSLSAEWAAIQDSAWRRPGLSVCPVVLDDAEIPVFLRSWQGIRLSRKDGVIDRAVDRVVEALGREPAESTVGVSERESSERAARFSEIIDTLTTAQKATTKE